MNIKTSEGCEYVYSEQECTFLLISEILEQVNSVVNDLKFILEVPDPNLGWENSSFLGWYLQICYDTPYYIPPIQPIHDNHIMLAYITSQTDTAFLNNLWSSAVSIVNRLQTGQPEFNSLYGREGIFSLHHHCVQTGSKPHSESYVVDMGGSSPRHKATWALSWPLTCTWCQS